MIFPVAFCTKRVKAIDVTVESGNFMCPTAPLPLHSSPPSKSLRNLEKGSDEYEAVKKKVNQRAAERLLYVCSKHGGVYTKFGQHISSMNHILPKEYTETLKVLQDRNPRSVRIFALPEAPFFFYLILVPVFWSPGWVLHT